MVVTDAQGGQVVDHVGDRPGQAIGGRGDAGHARRSDHQGGYDGRAASSAAPTELRNAL
jgi:hypothetical protein